MSEKDIEKLVHSIEEANNQLSQQLSRMLSDGIVISRSSATGMIRKVMGDSFLRYILNLKNEDDVEDALLNLPHQQIQELSQIVALITPILLEQPDNSTLPGTFCRCLDHDITLQDKFRVQNGGKPLPVCQTGDLLFDSIFESVQQILPTFSIAEWGKGENSGSRIDRLENYLNDDIADFENVLQKENVVQDMATIFARFVSNNDRSIPVGIVTKAFPVLPFDAMFLRKGLIATALYYSGTLDYTDSTKLRSGVRRAVDEFRNLFAKQSVNTVILTVFDGVVMQGDDQVVTNDGVLRKPTDYEKTAILPLDIKDPLIFESKITNYIKAIGNLLDVIEPKGDDLLAGFHWFVEREADSFSDHAIINQRNLVLRLRVSMILASKKANSEIAHMCGHWMPTTISSVGFVFDLCKASFDFGPETQPAEFSADEFLKWYTALSEVEFPEIALSRFVEAFSEKRDIKDAVLDLLIVLECLFGSESETTFKLSLCVAKLLSPNDGTLRKEKFNQMKEAYHFRSRIVHGDELKKFNIEKAQDILDILCSNVKQILKLLLSERRDLLSIRDNERINTIALS